MAASSNGMAAFVLGALLGAFGFIGVSAVSPTTTEVATITDVDVLTRAGKRDKFVVLGENESGRNFRIEGRTLHGYASSVALPIAAEATVATWTGRVEEVQANGRSSRGDRGWRGGWLLVGAVIILVAAARSMWRLRGSDSRSIAVFVGVSALAGVVSAVLANAWAS